MRYFAIGDIHGCSRALECLMDAVKPGPDDTLVFLGDYFDRGPDSRGVIEFLIQLGKRQRCVFLRGNHEAMMLDARRDPKLARGWQMVGGSATLHSYDYWGEGDWWDVIPAAHWEFIEKTERVFEGRHHIFVHACLDADLDVAEQPDTTLYWLRFEAIRPHKSGKKVVCGHTQDWDNEVRDVGYAVCIDTGAFLGGWLTCLEVESGMIWQANQKGEIRMAGSNERPAGN